MSVNSILNSKTYSIKITKPKEVKFATPFNIKFEIDNLEKTSNLSVSTETLNNSDFFLKTLKKENSGYSFELIPFTVGISTFPEITFTVDTSTLKTQPFQLNIKPLYNIDDKANLKEIYEILPLINYYIAILIILLIIALIIYFIYRFFKKKKVSENKAISEEINIPPYDYAMAQLDNLINSNLINENIKEYYSVLSNIFREYLEREFSINAMEMTTNDLMKNIKKNFNNFEILIKTREFLDNADLVKFAKYIPEKRIIESDTNKVREIIKTFKNIKEQEEMKKQQMQETEK